MNNSSTLDASYTEVINDTICENCGFPHVKIHMNECPICSFNLKPTKEEINRRENLKVRWGCYNVGFHGFTLKHCQTTDCNKCIYG